MLLPGHFCSHFIIGKTKAHYGLSFLLAWCFNSFISRFWVRFKNLRRHEVIKQIMEELSLKINEWFLFHNFEWNLFISLKQENLSQYFLTLWSQFKQNNLTFVRQVCWWRPFRDIILYLCSPVKLQKSNLPHPSLINQIRKTRTQQGHHPLQWRPQDKAGIRDWTDGSPGGIRRAGPAAVAV